MITRASLRAENACWTDERIAMLLPPAGITAQQIADGYAAAGVFPDDAHWALCYAAGASDRVLREHACWCARQALALVAEPDPRSVAAIEVAERYARGEATAEELAAARAAARAAAWAAASDAACAAARAAARAAQIQDLAARITAE